MQTKVILGDIEFGTFHSDSGSPPIHMALVQRPYKLMTLDKEVAEEVANALVDKGKYHDFVMPDLFDGTIMVTWDRKD